MEMTIKVSGQDIDDINKAIETYDKLCDEHKIYISFGDNLVMANNVVYMIRECFTPTYDFNDNLLFYRAKKRK